MANEGETVKQTAARTVQWAFVDVVRQAYADKKEPQEVRQLLDQLRDQFQRETDRAYEATMGLAQEWGLL